MRNVIKIIAKKTYHSLKCPNCREELNINNILENSSVSWPHNSWIYFKCPLCNNFSHAEITPGKIRTGQLDGAPGPCFIPCSEAAVDDFHVYTANDYIKCIYKGNEYLFRAKK